MKIANGLLALIGSIAVMLPSTATAQSAQQWRVSQADPSQPVVALVAGNGNFVGMGLACNASRAYLLIELNRAPVRDQVAAQLTIDGARFPIQMSIFGRPTYLAGVITDAGLIDALAGGQAVEVQVDQRALGTLGLAGSGAALRDALAGCWQASAADPSQESDMPPPQLTSADRTAIMRAAGFTQRGGIWTTCEGEERGEVQELRDINGDGTPEALVVGHGSACHGFVGSGFVLLTQQGNAWRIIYQQSGIPEFFARPGLAWPDIEIGGPGSDCFPFLRWDGRGYVQGGTSLGGEICTLQPRFAAGQAAPGAGPAIAGEGILGQVPIRLGYYVNQGERCDRPSYLYKFESARHLEIAEGNGRVDVLVYDYAGLNGQDEGFYFLQLADAGPEYPSDIGIRIMGGGRIELLIQDTVELVHCQEDQIPARMRR